MRRTAAAAVIRRKAGRGGGLPGAFTNVVVAL